MNPIIITVIAIVLTWVTSAWWYIQKLEVILTSNDHLSELCKEWERHSEELEKELRNLTAQMTRSMPDILGMGIIEPAEDNDYKETIYRKGSWDNPYMGGEYPQEPGEAKKWYEESSSAIGHREDHIPDDSEEDAENL